MAKNIKHSYEHLEISTQNPFECDTLQREKFADFLTSLVSNYSKGFVMAVNSSWGTGKTVFMRQWECVLKNKGYKATIFNAWDNDYFGEPTLAILSQFRYFFDKEKSLSEKVDSAWKTLQKVPQIAIKGVISKNLESYVGKEALKQISNNYKENIEPPIEYRDSDIGKYLTQRINFTAYKLALTEFAAATSEEGKPLVLIVDELDRCSPSYAVEILEKIKHLFNIPNIVFCLAIDKEQLKKTIQGHYGAYNFNAEEYLRRFFDIELELPAIPYFEFVNLLAEHFEITQYIRKKDDIFEFNRLSAEMAEKQKLTLRQLEKFYAHAKLVFSYYPNEKDGWLVAILLIVYKFFNETFENIRNRNYDLEKCAQLLKPLFDFSEEGNGATNLGMLLYHIDAHLNYGHRISVPDDFKFTWKYIFSDKELDTMTQCYILESIERRGSSCLENIMSKILFVKQTIGRP